MNAKELFLKNKELRDRWSAVVHADWFEEVLVYARGSFMDAKRTEAEMEGAKAYETILLSLCDVEGEVTAPILTGLHHDLDNPQPTKKQKPEPTK